MSILNKSLVTNLVALSLSLFGWYFTNPYIKSVGFYALSGGLTNWIAIHMLFEKIPFLYGSGIIPNRFESFKKAIRKMIVEQFFSAQRLDKFLIGGDVKKYISDVVVSKIDYNKIFDGFVDVLINSKYGSMIDTFLGGKNGLEGLRESFISNLETRIIKLLSQSDIGDNLFLQQTSQKIQAIIDSRLDELTPKMVKEIIQAIIRQHLGWLVVWGGIFGGLIGLIASLIV